MKIEYQKPWFLKPKLSQPQTNVIINNNYTISLTFKVDKTYKKDNKIGFFGIPGKNFGISYDYGVDLFVFEYWTKKKDENEEDKFHCHVYDCINDKTLIKGLNITLTYDGQAYKLYKDFKLFDTIINSDLIVDDYINEPIYIGCHNMDSLNEKHKCITEMDVYHFSIFNKALDNKTIENLVTNHSYFLNSFLYRT